MGVTMVGRSRAQIVCTNRKGLQILKIRNRNMFEESYNLIRYAEAFYLILGFHQILTGQNLIRYNFISDQTSSVLNLDPKRDLTQRLEPGALQQSLPVVFNPRLVQVFRGVIR